MANLFREETRSTSYNEGYDKMDGALAALSNYVVWLVGMIVATVLVVKFLNRFVFSRIKGWFVLPKVKQDAMEDFRQERYPFLKRRKP